MCGSPTEENIVEYVELKCPWRNQIQTYMDTLLPKRQHTQKLCRAVAMPANRWTPPLSVMSDMLSEEAKVQSSVWLKMSKSFRIQSVQI
ncbi:uncharacterized protein V6R79_002208 [Siganus canaliculatus]